MPRSCADGSGNGLANSPVGMVNQRCAEAHSTSLHVRVDAGKICRADPGDSHRSWHHTVRHHRSRHGFIRFPQARPDGPNQCLRDRPPCGTTEEARVHSSGGTDNPSPATFRPCRPLEDLCPRCTGRFGLRNISADIPNPVGSRLLYHSRFFDRDCSLHIAAPASRNTLGDRLPARRRVCQTRAPSHAEQDEVLRCETRRALWSANTRLQR